MAVNTYAPLLSEILTKIHGAKTKAQKVKILKENNTLAMRQILIWAFDPNVESALPEGAPPYIENDAPAGTEHTRLDQEADKLYRFVKGGQDSLQSMKRETLFVQMLEGLSQGEAEVVVAAKDKKLHQVYKGLSAVVVREAFEWNEEFYNPNK